MKFVAILSISGLS